jgi:hypothetical protein
MHMWKTNKVQEVLLEFMDDSNYNRELINAANTDRRQKNWSSELRKNESVEKVTYS